MGILDSVKGAIGLGSSDAENDSETAKAKKVVKKYSYASIAVGLIPVPLADMAALTAIQLKMVHSLAKIYDIDSSILSKSVILSLIGGWFPTTTAGAASYALRNVPVIGHIIGIPTMGAFGGASTYAVGKVFIQHFESGGTFLDFDPEKVRVYYQEEFNNGKKQNVSSGSKKP